jgi:uncharacterized C2H2 Zn-finger protein
MVFFYCDNCSQDCKNVRDFNKHIVSKEHREAIKIYNETLKLERQAELECQEEEQAAINKECRKSKIATAPCKKIATPVNNTLALRDSCDRSISTTENGEYMCDYCNQVYKYKKSYETHIEKCYKQTVRILQSRITETAAKKLIKLLSKQGDGPGTLTNAGKINNNTVTNNNGIVADTVNTQNIQTNIINVFPFGNEDLSMLTDEVKISIYKRGFTAYENLLNEIYKHDQNKNIFIANQRAGIVKFINENKELEIGYIKDAIEKIYDTKKDILLQIIDEYRGTQNKHAEKRIDDLEKAMSDNSVDKKYYTLAKLKLHQISETSKHKLKEIN